jgi:adenylosuccinate lyase
MVPRYARPAMTALWEPEARYRIWFEIEAHATEKLGELGVVPAVAAKALWDWWATNPAIDVDAIDAIEAVTKHDVIAFLTWVAEQVGDEARFMHQGMTSSDVLDTTLAVQLARATDILLEDMDALLAAIKRARRGAQIHPHHRPQPRHPCRAGDLRPQAGAGLCRVRPLPRTAGRRAQEIATCAISGAVGTFANVDPRVEAHVADKLGLAVEPVSTQVIPRDRHAMYFATLAVIASIERLAVEIRHLQRTEVLEAEEYFSPGQKGSSAMPHKRNPILTENLTGQARMIRAYALPALENVALWHERDISHSSVERFIGPDATITLDFALAR